MRYNIFHNASALVAPFILLCLVGAMLATSGCAEQQRKRAAAKEAKAAEIAAAAGGAGTDAVADAEAEAEEDESDKKKAKPLPLPELDGSYSFEVLWEAEAGRGLARRYSHKLVVTPAGKRLYVADAHGFVAAVNSETGKIIWENEVLSLEMLGVKKSKRRGRYAYLSAGPSLYDDTLFVGTTQAEVIALSAKNGKEKWRTALTGEVLAPPTANNELVFAQTSDGRLVALKRGDGSEVWSYDNQVPRLSLRGTAAPLLIADTIITAFASGKIGVIDAKNGELLCEQRIATPEGRSELQRIIDSDHAPIALDGVIYAASYQGGVRAFQFGNCNVLWEYKANTSKALSEGFSQIYLVDSDDRVIALNRNTGRPAWTNEDLRNRSLASPIAYHNFIIVGDKRGNLYAISQSEGKLLAHHKFGKKGIHTPLATQNRVIYVLTDAGKLNAVRVVQADPEDNS